MMIMNAVKEEWIILVQCINAGYCENSVVYMAIIMKRCLEIWKAKLFLNKMNTPAFTLKLLLNREV